MNHSANLKGMWYPNVLPHVSVCALAMLVGGCVLAAAEFKATKDRTHDGRLVSVTSDTLVMTYECSSDGPNGLACFPEGCTFPSRYSRCCVGSLGQGSPSWWCTLAWWHISPASWLSQDELTRRQTAAQIRLAACRHPLSAR